ncbi:hypothetical protein Q1695_006905 [Nippostrongylus brasiliensis]|nr:hypothetical protein Q1695_006905 [Nippostrongylus brasiliensis]
MLIGVLGVLLTLQASISKTITGTLMCSGKPYAGAEVQLQGEDVSECNYDGKCVLSRAHRFANGELSGKDSYSLGTIDLADKEKGGEEPETSGFKSRVSIMRSNRIDTMMRSRNDTPRHNLGAASVSLQTPGNHSSFIISSTQRRHIPSHHVHAIIHRLLHPSYL